MLSPWFYPRTWPPFRLRHTWKWQNSTQHGFGFQVIDSRINALECLYQLRSLTSIESCLGSFILFHKPSTNNTTNYFSRQSQSPYFFSNTPQAKDSVDPQYPFQPSRAVDHHEVSKFLSKQLSLDRKLLKSLRYRICFLQRSCGKLQTLCHWLWQVPNLQRKLVEGLHAVLSECVQKWRTSWWFVPHLYIHLCDGGKCRIWWLFIARFQLQRSATAASLCSGHRPTTADLADSWEVVWLWFHRLKNNNIPRTEQ